MTNGVAWSQPAGKWICNHCKIISFCIFEDSLIEFACHRTIKWWSERATSYLFSRILLLCICGELNGMETVLFLCFADAICLHCAVGFIMEFYSSWALKWEAYTPVASLLVTRLLYLINWWLSIYKNLNGAVNVKYALLKHYQTVQTCVQSDRFALITIARCERRLFKDVNRKFTLRSTWELCDWLTIVFSMLNL